MGVVCSGCGETNRDGARFCATCGTRVMARCATCDADLVEGSRFCDSCGAPVLAGQPTSDDDVGTQTRKVVTVLFGDLVGSTALQERMDPESVRSLMSRCYSVLRDCVERRGGRVVKFVGDGAMAVFGVPEVAEDDAARAVAAGAEMVAAIDGLGAELKMRVGINTGEVVVDEDDPDIVGDVVNVAARLEGATPPGTVLVSDATWRLTRHTARFSAAELVPIRGRTDPVVAHPLIAVGPKAEDTTVAPFVGREAELGLLIGALDTAATDRALRMVTVIGSPGLGKSRLGRELEARVADRASSVTVACMADGGSAIGPIADLLEGLAAIEVTDDERVANVRRGLAAGEAAPPEELFWAVRRSVEAAAQSRPLVVQLEDLHWAEPLLLDLVEHLAEWVRGEPVLLVIVARPELRELRPALTTPRGTAQQILTLSGLDQGATEALARELLESDDVPAALVAKLGTATEGNPLFVRELIHMLVDDGVLERSDRGWDLTVAADSVEVPPTIQALLAARIDQLGESERTVLERAAIVGAEVYRGALEALVPAEVAGRLDEVLEGLRRKELLEPSGAYWIDERVLRFHHALIRDAAYARLLRGTRARLHERTARWLDDKTGGSPEHDEAVGYHLEQAQASYRALGPLDDDGQAVAAEAATRLSSAAGRALERDDLPAAASLAERAIACLDTSDSARGELLIIQVEALLGDGRVVEAGPVIEELTSLGQLDRRLEAWAACFEVQRTTLTTAHGLEDAAAELPILAEQLAELGDQVGAAKGHRVHASVLARLGQVAATEAALDRALSAARAANNRRQITSVLTAAPQAALAGPSPVPRAGGRCLDVVRLVRITTGARVVESVSIRCQAILEAMRGRFDAARTMLASARHIAEELGSTNGLLDNDLSAGFVELYAGAPAAAAPYLERAREGFATLGVGADAARAAALLARVAMELGRDDEALEMVEESERLGSWDLRSSITRRSVQAQVAARRGDSAEAIRLAEEAISIAAQTDALVDHGDACAALSVVLRINGDVAGAERAAAEARALYERKGATALIDLLGAGDQHQPAATPSQATPDIPPVSNETSRRFVEILALIAAHRVDDVRPLVSPDVVLDDMREGLGDLVEGVEPVLELIQVIVGLDLTRIDPTVLAVRGERLALVASTWGGKNSYEVPLIQLARTDEQGRVVDIRNYVPEALPAALSALGEAYIAGEGAPHATGLRMMEATFEAYQKRDWGALAAIYSPDIVSVDHRPGTTMTTTGLDEMMQRHRTMIEIAPDYLLVPRRIVEIDDLVVLSDTVSLGSNSGSAGYGIARLILSAVDRVGGKITRFEYFNLDQLPMALARFRELTGAGPDGADGDLVPIENEASRVSGRIRDLMLAGRLDELGEVLAPDVVMDDRRAGLGSVLTGLAAVREMYDVIVGMGLSGIDNEVLATRGEQLCLVQSTLRGDFEVTFVSLRHLDEAGRIDRLVMFSVGDLGDALETLDEVYLEDADDNVELFWLGLGVARAMADHDWDRLRTLYAPNIVSIDHRPGSYPPLEGNDALVARHQTMVEIAPSYLQVVRAILAVDEQSLLADTMAVTTTADGATYRIPRLLLYRVDRALGQIDRFELFGVDQREIALARFRELSGGAGGCPSNGATDLTEQSVRDGALPAGARLEDHRNLGRGQLFVAGARSRRIAVRGQRGAMVRVVAPDGDDALAVVALDASGTGSVWRLFDVEDLTDAHVVLGEAFLADEGASAAVWMRTPLCTWLACLAREDWEGLREVYDPQVVLVDHVNPGVGDKHGFDEMVDFHMVMLELAPDHARIVRQVAMWADHVALGESVTGTPHAADPTAAVELPNWQVTTVTAENRIVGIERFGTNRYEDAVARFHEVAGTAAQPSNAASRLQERTFEAMAAGDWDTVRSSMAETMTAIDRRPGMWSLLHGPEEVTGSLRSLRDLGVDRVDLRNIDLRGERLALTHTHWIGAQFESEALFVIEVDEDGHSCASVAFEPEQTAEARAEFEGRARRHRAIERCGANAALENLDRMMHALFLTGDREALRALIGEEYTFEDRRPGLGVLAPGRDDVVEQLFSIRSLGTTHVHLEPLAIRGDRLLLTRMHWIGDPFDVQTLMVLEVQDAGHCVGAVNFEESQLDEAFAELEARARRLDPPSNRAIDTLRAFLTLGLTSRDRDATLAMIRPDTWFEDRRPGLLSRVEGAEAAVDQIFVVGELGAFEVELHPIELLGERVALVRSHWDLDGFVTTMLLVATIDAEARGSSMTLFEEDQLDEALALARDAHRAVLAETPGNAAADNLLQMADAIVAGDRDLMRSLMAPTCWFEDRRPGLANRVDGHDAISEQLMVIHDMGRVRVSGDIAEVRGDRLALMRTSWLTQFEVRALFLVEVDGRGRTLAWIAFEEGQLDEARAELDERAQRLAPLHPAAAVMRQLLDLMVRSDRAGLEALLQPACTFEDHRPGMGVRLDHRDDLVEQFLVIGSMGFTDVELEVLECFGDRLALLHLYWDLDGFGTDTYFLAEIDGHGLGISAHQYDETQLDEARAKGHELHLAAIAGQPTNAAFRSQVAGVEATLAGDWDAFRTLCRPDCRMEDRRPGFGVVLDGPDELVENLRSIMDLGLEDATIEPLVLRGERLALIRHHYDNGAYTVTFLLMYEVDDDGLYRFGVAWEPDQLDEALVDIEARYHAGEGAVHATWLAPTSPGVLLAHAQRDWDAVRALYAPDIELRDHRPMSQTHFRGIDAALDYHRIMVDLDPTHRQLMRRRLVVGDHVLVAELISWGTGVDGELGPTEVANLLVTAHDAQGRTTQIERFDQDQITEAMARYEELAAPGHPQTVAERNLHRTNAALLRGDADAIESLYADDATSDDRRRTMGLGHTDRSTTMQALHALVFDQGRLDGIDAEVIGRAGEHKIAAHERLVWQEGAAEIEMIVVLTVRDDGLTTHVAVFDGDQRAAALAELTGEPVDEPTNLALRTQRALLDAILARDFDGCLRLLSPGCVSDDLRPGAGIHLGSADAAVENFRTIADIGVARVDVVPLMLRGDHLSLSWSVWVGHDGYTIDILTLSEMDDDGRICRRINWEPDQLADAILAIEERYRAGEGADDPAWVRAVTPRIELAHARRDWDELGRAHSPDVEMRDHRQLGVGVIQGLDAAIDFHKAMVELDPTHHFVTRRRFATSDHAALSELLSIGTSSALDGGHTERATVILTTHDGHHRLRSLELFELTQLSEARARYDELVAQGGPPQDTALSEPTNAAFRAQRVLLDAILGQDYAAARRLLAPGCVSEDRRPGVHSYTDDPDTTAENFRTVAGLGVQQVNLVPVMLRGERLALARAYWLSDAGFTVDLVSLCELDDDGRICHRINWEPEQLDEAIEAATERYFADEGAPFAGWLRVPATGILAHLRRDWEQMREVYSPEVVFRDHRSLTGATLRGHDEVIGYARTMVDVDPTHIQVLRRHLDIGDHVILNELVSTGTGSDAERGATETVSLLVTVSDEGGRILSVDRYEAHDLPAARARFDELAAECQARGPQLGEPTNAAFRAKRALFDALADRDFERLSGLLQPDCVTDDRRPGFGMYLDSAEATLDNLRVIAELGVVRVELTPLLLRGERLALSRARWMLEGDFVVEMLNGVELGDDGVCRRTSWEPDQFEAALIDIDERFRAGEGADQPEWLAGASPHIEVALLRRDWEALRDLYIPDVRLQDRRALGFGVVEGIESAIQYHRAMTDVDPSHRMQMRRWLAIGDHVAMMEMLNTGTLATTDGGPTERVAIVVSSHDARGRLIAFEMFDPSDLPAAQARFDELEAERDPETLALGEPTNAAFRAQRALFDAVVARDFDTVRSLLSPTSVTDDRRPGLGMFFEDPEAAIDHLRVVEDLGLAGVELSPIWLRGERLVLSRCQWIGNAGFTADMIVAYELDDDGICRRTIWDPDQFDEALIQTDEWFRAGEGADSPEWLVRASPHTEVAHARSDWDALRTLYSHDVYIRDHRTLGVGTIRGTEQVIQYHQTMREVDPSRRLQMRRHLEIGDHVAMLEFVTTGTASTPDGGPTEHIGLFVSTHDVDGRLTAFEIFDHGDLAGARARFDQLEAQGHPQTMAVRNARRIEEGLLARDIDALEPLYTPDAIGDDRRATVGIGVSDREAIFQVHRLLMYEQGGLRQMENRVLGTNGDRAAAFHALWGGGESIEIEMLFVSWVNECGECTKVVFFDADKEDEALAELALPYD